MSCSLGIPAILALVATNVASTRRGLVYFGNRSGFQLFGRGGRTSDAVLLSLFLICQEIENPGMVLLFPGAGTLLEGREEGCGGGVIKYMVSVVKYLKSFFADKFLRQTALLFTFNPCKNIVKWIGLS